MTTMVSILSILISAGSIYLTAGMMNMYGVISVDIEYVLCVLISLTIFSFSTPTKTHELTQDHIVHLTVQRFGTCLTCFLTILLLRTYLVYF